MHISLFSKQQILILYSGFGSLVNEDFSNLIITEIKKPHIKEITIGNTNTIAQIKFNSDSTYALYV